MCVLWSRFRCSSYFLFELYQLTFSFDPKCHYRALIFLLIPHIARKLTLFMAIFIDRGLKLLNVSIKQAIFIYCLLDTVTVAGVYDLRRLQIKRCGRLGPRTVLALDCCPSLLLFSCFNEQLSHKSSKINKSNDRCAPFYSICCTAVRVATISLISEISDCGTSYIILTEKPTSLFEMQPQI